MTNWVAPDFSKSRVSKAGNAISTGTETAEDIEVLENWRASHAYVLNTFQSNLRQRARGLEAYVGTRLKRRSTIENKLRRFPTMQLARMHDIAGCRIIFSGVDELKEFRQSFHEARFDHKRRSADEDRWNYIDHPKDDGYRGIHDVYEYKVRSVGGVKWNGLLIEIQYRTAIQHAWATAVEVAGLLTHNNPKFGQGSAEMVEFFKIVSEIFARCFEGMHSGLPTLSKEELFDRMWRLENELRIIQLFRRVNSKVVEIDFRKNNILVFPLVSTEDENASELQIFTFDKVFKAIERYDELEKRYKDLADVVLVRADSFENMRYTFRNYFADTSEFLHLLEDAQCEDWRDVI